MSTARTSSAGAAGSAAAAPAASSSPRTTRLLVLALLLGAVVSWIALQRMDKARNDAAAARRSLVRASQAMEEIAQLQRAGTSTSLDAPELTAQLRAAALAAGLRDAPDHDSASPARLGTTDYAQTLVFLHFGPVTLRQLTTFLHHLGAADPSSRVQQIELSAPDIASAAGAGRAGQAAQERDLWESSVVVAYLTYSPARASRTND